MFNRQNNQQGYYNPQNDRILYQMEEMNRRIRNLNNRVRRIEKYLGLRCDDKYDEDIFTDE
jgi:hypothetical protein